MTTIEGQALRSEDNGALACSGLQTELMERTPEKDASAELSTKHGIDAVRFNVFAPPGSPLDRQSVMIFPRRWIKRARINLLAARILFRASGFTYNLESCRSYLTSLAACRISGTDAQLCKTKVLG